MPELVGESIYLSLFFAKQKGGGTTAGGGWYKGFTISKSIGINDRVSGGGLPRGETSFVKEC